MRKRILVLFADGRRWELGNVPSSAEIKEIVGGDWEHVRVLDRLQGGKPVYTAMFVNETGLLNDLPRNEAATAAYQRNVRTFYATHANPFEAAKEAWRKGLPPGSVIHDMTPPHLVAKGYKDDPWIAGTAVLFEGWTENEVDDAMSVASGASNAR